MVARLVPEGFASARFAIAVWNLDAEKAMRVSSAMADLLPRIYEAWGAVAGRYESHSMTPPPLQILIEPYLG